MLSQDEVDYLLALMKHLKHKKIIFPQSSEYKAVELTSINKDESFIIDINRKGKISISKLTLQTRYKRVYNLLRIDLDGPDHTNPDGHTIPCPHIHIYREGFEDKYAFPLEDHLNIENTTDLVEVLKSFLLYNNVIDEPTINYQLSIQ